MITSIEVIRRFNLNALLRDRPEFDRNRRVFAETLEINYSTMCGLLNPNNSMLLSDQRARIVEKKLKLDKNWMDQDRVPADFKESDIPQGRAENGKKNGKKKPPVSTSTRLTTSKAKREKPPPKVVETKSGVLTFEADGFLLRIELRRGDEDTAEVTRAALRIVEIRSR